MRWCFTRVFIRAPAGRQRFNVWGALNAITPALVRVTNDTYITACPGCAVLHRLAALHLTVPITVVLDKARYPQCHLVEALAASLQSEVLYLPAYSPNLNLIDRVGKVVKKPCLYSTDYAHVADFKHAIFTCWSHAHTTYQQELDSLLTLRFQSFKKSQVMAG